MIKSCFILILLVCIHGKVFNKNIDMEILEDTQIEELLNQDLRNQKFSNVANVKKNTQKEEPAHVKTSKKEKETRIPVKKNIWRPSSMTRNHVTRKVKKYSENPVTKVWTPHSVNPVTEVWTPHSGNPVTEEVWSPHSGHPFTEEVWTTHPANQTVEEEKTSESVKQLITDGNRLIGEIENFIKKLHLISKKVNLGQRKQKQRYSITTNIKEEYTIESEKKNLNINEIKKKKNE